MNTIQTTNNTTTMSIEDAMALIQQLQIENTKLQLQLTKKELKKEIIKIKKPYVGKSGYYFEVDFNAMMTDDTCIDLCTQILNGFDSIPKSNFNEATSNYLTSNGKVIMWAQNESFLIIGQNRSGAKGLTEDQKFVIPTQYLSELGDFEGDKAGLIKAKELIGYDDFIQNKKNEEKSDKISEKLRKMGGRR
jgi:hypothetical protein